ncbi:MAG: carboxypeptidase-like regulatory domain-containing protein [Gemmatimonadales bacterium]
MRDPVLAVAATLLLAASPVAAAQTVRGQLVDSVTRTPLPGAYLTLIDAAGVERARGITDHAGRFTLAAPAPGTYRVRSKRIGFQPYVSAPLRLEAGRTYRHRAAIDPVPIALEEIVVAGERQCDLADQGAGGPAVAALWEEVREALTAVAWSARVSGYWYEVTMFERDVTTGGRRVGHDSTWRKTGYQRAPFRSAPAGRLADEGYVVVTGDDWIYYAPDADVLTSDPFVRTHCFETRIGEDETAGLLGLAFEPIPDRPVPDIAGVLWISEETGELRHLEFAYTDLPQDVVAPRAGGRVEFLRVPSGAWVVRDWVIRMPRAAVRYANYGPDRPVVTGFRESGGRAVRITARDGRILFGDTAAPLARAPAAPPPPRDSVPVADSVAPQPPPEVEPPDSGPPDSADERPARRIQDLLLEDEFHGTTATDAYELVRQYRPSWLRWRGPSSIRNPNAGRLQVYVGGMHWGDVVLLRQIPIGDVLGLQYYSATEATTRFGTGHSGGVIQVLLR